MAIRKVRTKRSTSPATTTKSKTAGKGTPTKKAATKVVEKVGTHDVGAKSNKPKGKALSTVIWAGDKLSFACTIAAVLETGIVKVNPKGDINSLASYKPGLTVPKSLLDGFFGSNTVTSHHGKTHGRFELSGGMLTITESGINWLIGGRLITGKQPVTMAQVIACRTLIRTGKAADKNVAIPADRIGEHRLGATKADLIA